MKERKTVEFKCERCGIRWFGKKGTKYCMECRDKIMNIRRVLASKAYKERQKNEKKNN